MESSSIPSEMDSPGEDIMLMETVKRIVTHEGRNESEETFFLISQNQAVQYPEGPNVEETVSHTHQTDVALEWIRLCRICANSSDHTIPIFEGYGAQHDLSTKILKYLPIHISESDTLPLQLCENCANLLMAWHELSVGCLNAERKLLELQDAQLQEKQQYYNPTSLDNIELTTPILTTASTTIASNITNSPPNQQDNDDKNGVCDTEKIYKSNRWTRQVSKDESERYTQINSPRNERSEEHINIEETRLTISSEKSLSLTHSADFDEKLERANSTDSHSNNSGQVQKSQEKHTIDYQGCTKRLKHLSGQHAESIRSKMTEDSGCASHKCEECGKVLSTSYNLLIHRNIHTGMRPYICTICDKSFRSASGLNRHVRDVHDRVKNFACDICGRHFASKASRDEHRRIHSGERPHVCETCGKSFKQKASLHVHRLYHSQVLPHRCALCDRGFRRKQELDKHVSWHSDRKPYACDICNERFRSKGCVARHRHTHTVQRSHVCAICGAKFTQERYLKRHCDSLHTSVGTLKNQIVTHDQIIARSHSRRAYKTGEHQSKIYSIQTKTFNVVDRDSESIISPADNIDNKLTERLSPTSTSSEICLSDKLMNDAKKKSIEDKGSNSASQMQASCAKRTKTTRDTQQEAVTKVSKSNEHLEKNVQQSKCKKTTCTSPTMVCKSCNKKFCSRKSYWAHVRTHSGEKSYTCHICGKQFVQSGSLYYHLKHVHDGVKNHTCDICGRSFAMKTAMEDHRRIHTGERPYVCHTCGKTFKTKASLYIHSKTHTDEFPHKCTYCGKRFRWRQQMLGHLTVHTGEKNHTCDVCGKGFGVKNDLTRHKRVHSEEKPYTCQQCGISFGQKRYLKSHERLKLGTCGLLAKFKTN
ncbi:zinc finger protein 595 isoform X3 [Solenopsis invicta]|uniref:zinc finger protein 595 isoform X3 n=1 Tax=Solenopsis invicta TaxID=13686 RepID=UPI00193D0DBF|nr:zinc finger protein 595 isoform X3 [Solenopsis invicta]